MLSVGVPNENGLTLYMSFKNLLILNIAYVYITWIWNTETLLKHTARLRYSGTSYMSSH